VADGLAVRVLYILYCTVGVIPPFVSLFSVVSYDQIRTFIKGLFVVRKSVDISDRTTGGATAGIKCVGCN
jgi:hypothetical protein